MNISSKIFSSHDSNSSDLHSNGTVKMESHFDMFSVINIICVLFGLPANSYVIWLIVTGTGNGLAAEFFSLNISVCEILLCLETLMAFLGDAFFILIIVVIFIEGLPITGRPLFQCLISVERYLAVVHPVTFLKFKPLRYRVICAVVVWVTTFGSSGVLITLFMASVHNDVYLSFVLAQLLVFIFIQMFCCVSVLRALKQSGPGERGREREEENHMKRRAFYLILITTVTMVLTYLPMIISMLFSVSPADSSHTVVSVGFTCFLAGGLVQPFLFLYRVGKLPFLHTQ